jgi:hypothetical protein
VATENGVAGDCRFYKKVTLPTVLMGSTYHNHKQLTLPLKMANRFIAYIPSQRRRNPAAGCFTRVYLRNSALWIIASNSSEILCLSERPLWESDLPVQKVNRDDGIMVASTQRFYQAPSLKAMVLTIK